MAHHALLQFLEQIFVHLEYVNSLPLTPCRPQTSKFRPPESLSDPTVKHSSDKLQELDYQVPTKLLANPLPAKSLPLPENLTVVEFRNLLFTVLLRKQV